MQPSAPAPPSVPPPEEEPAELAHFREEWKAELQRRKREPHEPSLAEPAPVHDVGTPGPSTAVRSTQPGPAKQATLSADHPIFNGESTAAKSPTLGTALSAYRQAVLHEQRGELDDALLLYRQAFRLDPNVDRAYHREEMLASVLQAKAVPTKKFNAVRPSTEEIDALTSAMQQSFTVKPLATGKAVVTGTLASLVDSFPEQVRFEPENELEPIPINILPDELLVLVLRKLDTASIERFARVNRKARVLSLDSAIWRELVVNTYKPPQIPDVEDMLPVIELHLSDYRRVYVEQPRIRLDGVYIAICHYVRPGLSENAWVNVTHLITYHRYLRFFPNGQVLSLLANEEHSPQQVIPMLKPTLRMKGLFVGNWELSGTTLNITNLIDASGRFPLPGLEHTSLSSPPSSTREHHANTSDAYGSVNAARYIFVMSLHLRSRPIGRWNRLDIQTYDSVNLETGDATPVALKHERPFWFSKVRSYAP